MPKLCIKSAQSTFHMNHTNNKKTNSESTHATHHDLVYNTRHQFYRFVNERGVQTAG